MSRWYLKKGDGEVGPGSDEQLRSAFKKGALSLDAMVRREDRQEWVSLKESGILPPDDANPFMAGQVRDNEVGAIGARRSSDSGVSKPLIHKDMFKEKPRFGRRSEPQYASFADRMIALIIDVVIFWVASSVVLMFLSPILYSARGIFAGLMLSYVFQIVISVAYFVMLQHEWGYTIGRKIMGIHVEMEDRSKPNMQTLIIRYVGAMISGLILGIGYLMALSDQKMRTLHDKLAGTIVVKDS